MKYLDQTFQNTANDIFSMQNEDFLLKCNVAQRSEYSFAKKIKKWETIITLTAAILSIVASIIDIEIFNAISGLFAIAVLIANKYIQKSVNFHKKHAASIQKYIDVTLFSRALNGSSLEWGEIPIQSDLSESIQKYNKADISTLRNWYSNYSTLPIEKQILFCQKENIRWSDELLKKYRNLHIIVLLTVTIILLILFFLINPTFVKFICIISWIAPLAEYTFSIFEDINNSIVHLRKANELCNDIERVLESQDCQSTKKELINLQYIIQEYRESALLVPDWFYKKYQKVYQENENNIAERIVTQSTESGD